METVLESKTSTNVTESSLSLQIKAASAPIAPNKTEDEKLKTQISAPSYLFSLKRYRRSKGTCLRAPQISRNEGRLEDLILLSEESQRESYVPITVQHTQENDAPPFRKPDKEPRPKVLIGTLMNENEAVAMIASSDGVNNYGLRQFLGYFLVEKEIIMNYNLPEKNFLISLLLETIDYAAQRDFSAFKLACLFTIYLSSHLYFKWYYWQSPGAVWFYFKELIIRHTIEDSPDGEEVFQPDECYDIISHFHTIYLTNLPLIHILTFGAHRLKFSWPFKPK